MTPSKRDLVAECAYILNDNKLMEVNPALKSHKEIIRFNERYFAKIVKLSGDSLVAVGGLPSKTST